MQNLDKKRKEEFKRYEMNKEHEYRQELKHAKDKEEEERLRKEHEESQKRHKEHPKMNHPVCKNNLGYFLWKLLSRGLYGQYIIDHDGAHHWLTFVLNV